jgi:hypothetical protein
MLNTIFWMMLKGFFELIRKDCTILKDYIYYTIQSIFSENVAQKNAQHKNVDKLFLFYIIIINLTNVRNKKKQEHSQNKLSVVLL